MTMNTAVILFFGVEAVCTSFVRMTCQSGSAIRDRVLKGGNGLHMKCIDPKNSIFKCVIFNSETRKSSPRKAYPTQVIS